MELFGIHAVDFVVVIIYLLGITCLGMMTKKAVHGTTDFFMGGRKFGKALLIMHNFGTGTHTDQPVAVAGQCYRHGLSGIWAQWLWLFCTPFYWLLAPIFRRMRCITTADFFQERYGSFMSVFYALGGIVFMMVSIGMGLKGTGETVSSITNGMISLPVSVAVMTLLFVSYGVSGGLFAVVLTDFVQGFLIIILSFLLVPFTMAKVGGMAGLHQQISSEMFNLTGPSQYTVFYIAMLSINALVGIVAQPHTMEGTASGKTEMEGRVGFCYGTFLKRICTVAWSFVGLACIALFPGVANEDRVFGMAVQQFLPVGVTGLMIASMLAAIMSSCDSFMIAGSALFTRNIYARYINPSADDRKSLKVGRIVALFVVAGGIVVTFLFPSVISILKFFWKITAFFGIPFWMAILFKRSNRWGAMASVIGAVSTWVLWKYVYRPELSEAYEYLAYLVVGFAVGIVVSLLTPAEDRKMTDAFYAKLRRPVVKGEKEEE